MIYCEQPIFVLFPILLLLWQIFTYWLKRKKQISSPLDITLTGIGVVGHTTAISVILLNNGTLSDVLLLVLLSGAFSLLLSPQPNKTSSKTEEDL